MPKSHQRGPAKAGADREDGVDAKVRVANLACAHVQRTPPPEFENTTQEGKYVLDTTNYPAGYKFQRGVTPAYSQITLNV